MGSLDAHIRAEEVRVVFQMILPERAWRPRPPRRPCDALSNRVVSAPASPG
jgi:hypothetical protein